MKTRTISIFRAHYNVRITELAQKLEMTTEELTAIDEIYPVPESVAEKIITEYNLLPFYFTEELEVEKKAKSQKKTPNNPFWYFFGVSLVATIVLSFITIIPTSIVTVVTTLATESVEFVGDLMFIMLNLTLLVLTLGQCVLVSRHILKKTTLTGKINEYKFLWYILPNAILLIPNLMGNYIAGDFHSNIDDTVGYIPVSALLGFGVSVVLMLIGFAVQSYIFVLAIEEDATKQNKKMRIVAICSIISYVAYYIIRVAFVPLDGAKNWIASIITAVFTILVAIGLIIKKEDNKKLDNLIYTVFPLLAILGSDIFRIIWK